MSGNALTLLLLVGIPMAAVTVIIAIVIKKMK